MSLDVPTALLERAEQGEISDAEFLEVVRESLPYAWTIITGVIADLRSGTDEFADDASIPPTDTEQGQLLRAMASDPIRGAIERHFDVKLAFQNCHRVAAFRLGDADGPAYRTFVSTRAQLLAQSPELKNC
ncbi:MAG: hypothetical protein HOQ24_16660 [Mycobacteriaceae bacterium]|nr:hypothetical protein [Mycobacteriaceae bacterium]